MTPCPFCSSAATPEAGFLWCSTCGISTDFTVARWMGRMSPRARANAIGHYHASNGWAYGWCFHPASKSERRAYARGYMSVRATTKQAEVNRVLYAGQAKQDARWF